MLLYQKFSFVTETRANILVEQGFRLDEVSLQYGLYMKVLCALITKHREARSVEDNSRSGPPKTTTTTLDHTLVQTSLTYRHLTSPETG